MSDPLYSVGDRVRFQDMEGVVVEVLPGQIVHYRVAFPHRIMVLPEQSLKKAPTTPQEKLLTAAFDDLPYFNLRTRATRIKVAYTFEDLVSLTNARVELKPHQVFVAHRIVQHPKPRFLLADEVGLGKTIEAGMILKELRARGLVERVLILVPANLVLQWWRELRSKFNEDFIPYDGTTLRYLERERPDENPWILNPRIITSLQLARQETKQHQIAEVRWDMVIIDEAHHLRRYQEGYDERGRPKVRNTQTYLLGEAASGNTESLLFLTATPLQLRAFELYSILALLDPSLFSGYEHFERYRTFTLPRINEAYSLVSAVPGPDEYRRLQLLWGDLQRESSDLPLLPPLDAINGQELGKYRAALRDLHHLSKVMVRNRRREIGGFPPRRAHVVPVPLTTQELALYDAVTEYVRQGYRTAVRAQDIIAGFLMVTFQKILASSTRALLAALERRRAKLIGDILDSELAKLIGEEGTTKEVLAQVLASDGEGSESESDEVSQVLTRAEFFSERELVGAEVKTLDGLIARIRAVPQDSKAIQLLGALRGIFESDPQEKVLIFTQFLETQRYLKGLLESEGYTVEFFSGNMSAHDKDEAVERFRERAQILISTEAGGEGRNFQFCHIMFNYDLPWNPMRIEQRIGRLDRIGQRKEVHIYNFAATATIEERILEVLHNRIKLFEETIGSLDPILGEFERDLQRLIMESRPNFAREFENFGVDWEKRIADARAMEEQLRDFVMDFRSFRRDEANRLLGRHLPVTHADLSNLVKDFLALYPTSKFEERTDGTVAIDVPRAFVEQFAGKVRDTYVGTFDPQVALAKESLDFFAIGHVLVDAILELCYKERFGGLATFRALDSPKDRNFWGVQCNFLIEYRGVRTYPRFVPVVVGLDGVIDNERTQRLLSAPDITANPPAFPEGWRDKVAEALRKSEEALIDHISQQIGDLEGRNLNDYNALVARTRKFYGFRVDRAREKLSEDEATLERLSRSRDPNDRRVLPIWEKRVQDGRSRIESLEHEREREILALEKRQQIDWSFELVNVALLYVPN